MQFFLLFIRFAFKDITALATKGKELLIEMGLIENVKPSGETKEITVLSVTETVINGNSVSFYEAEENGEKVFYQINISDDKSAIFIKAGDVILVNAEASETKGIYNVIYWSYKE